MSFHWAIWAISLKNQHRGNRYERKRWTFPLNLEAVKPHVAQLPVDERPAVALIRAAAPSAYAVDDVLFASRVMDVRRIEKGTWLVAPAGQV